MDLLAIGDTVVDAFIKLKDAEVHCDINSEHCTISMRFGDKIPFESATIVAGVGNAANAAVGASRLGLKAGLLTWLGKDRDGEDCLAALKKESVDTLYVSTQSERRTNYHYVLWYGDERTILIKHEDFDCMLPTPPPSPKAVYLSSLSEHCLPLHDDLVAWLNKNPATLFAFQPGTFQIKAGLKRLEGVYKRADIVFANKEEYQRILGTAEEDVKKLMKIMRSQGPKIAVLTNGSEGAYAFDGENAFSIPIYPDPKPPFERTGAGDAFASTIVVALILGKTLPEALTWGPVNSMSVVQYIGAQRGLLSRTMLEGYLKLAQPDFKVTPI